MPDVYIYPPKITLQEVHFKGFRSLQDTRFTLQPGINIMVGQNASGKTNVLEALLHAFYFEGNTPKFKAAQITWQSQWPGKENTLQWSVENTGFSVQEKRTMHHEALSLNQEAQPLPPPYEALPDENPRARHYPNEESPEGS